MRVKTDLISLYTFYCALTQTLFNAPKAVQLHFISRVKKGHDSTLKHLLRNRADINACTENGATPLHIACENERDSTVLLLSYKADIDICSENGSFPLHFACENGQESIAQFLMN